MKVRKLIERLTKRPSVVEAQAAQAVADTVQELLGGPSPRPETPLQRLRREAADRKHEQATTPPPYDREP